MTNENIYKAIEEIDEKYIEEAEKQTIKRKRKWVKWTALAASLCLVIGLGGMMRSWRENMSNGGNALIQAKGSEILDSHRADFIPEIDTEILAQFEEGIEVKKVYRLLVNEWFLSEELADFSQIVTTDVFYVTPAREDDLEWADNPFAYSSYQVTEAGAIEWWGSTCPPDDVPIPYGMCGLSHEIIEKDLEGISYEDYIITYSPTLGVFIWVRSEEGDKILTYVPRPDLTGISDGEIYTLEELRIQLREAYLKQ